MSDSAGNLPHSPQRAPYVVQVQEGRAYLWCSCGLSRNQPWCDGAHAGSGFEPVPWERAIETIAAKLETILEESGPAAIFNYKSGGAMGLMKHVTEPLPDIQQVKPEAVRELPHHHPEGTIVKVALNQSTVLGMLCRPS